MLRDQIVDLFTGVIAVPSVSCKLVAVDQGDDFSGAFWSLSRTPDRGTHTTGLLLFIDVVTSSITRSAFRCGIADEGSSCELIQNVGADDLLLDRQSLLRASLRGRRRLPSSGSSMPRSMRTSFVAWMKSKTVAMPRRAPPDRRSP